MAFDEYEKQKWIRIRETRARICAALRSLDDAMSEEMLEIDAWGKAYTLIHGIVNDFSLVEKTVLVVRCRKMEDQEFGKRPTQPA